MKNNSDCFLLHRIKLTVPPLYSIYLSPKKSLCSVMMEILQIRCYDGHTIDIALGLTNQRYSEIIDVQ